MNRSQLVSVVANKTGMSKKDSEAAVNAVFETITEQLASGDKVQLTGFGTFETKTRAARTGHNPRTMEEITIEASTAPTFKAGSALKEAIDKK